MRLTRKDNVWTYYVAKVDEVTKKHTARASGTFIDKSRKYMKNLTQIQLHFGQSNAAPVPEMFAGDLKVTRFNAPAPGVPVIAKGGDEIEMNFENGQTLLNGEPIKARRELVSTYFKLPPGENFVLLEPFADITSATISVRGRSL